MTSTCPTRAKTDQESLPSAVVWWSNALVMRQFVCDLVAAELAVLRRSGTMLPLRPWLSSTHLHDDLGVDSLELLQLATVLAETLHLHESGIADYLLARQTIGDWAEIAQAGLSEFSASMTFRTSGSTGAAKSCTHCLADLWQETRELASLLSTQQRIFSAVPSHHIYGFIFTILLPQALALADRQVIDIRDSSPAALRTFLQPYDLVIAHPAFWQAAATMLTSVAGNVVGVTSTAPCPDDVSAALRTAGLHRLLQIFGSSETAGIGWRETETAPYTLFKHWQRTPDNPAALMRHSRAGSTLHVPCPDKLTWCDARHFFAAGRLDAAVQVGGINVYPSAVRQVLLEHPHVQDAAVRLMRSDEGNRLKAFIVARDRQLDQTELQQELVAWVQKRLRPPERPKAFSFGAQCPTGQQGKASDWII